MVVAAKAVPKRIGANSQCQQDHSHFKTGMVNNVDPKQGQAAEKQG